MPIGQWMIAWSCPIRSYSSLDPLMAFATSMVTVPLFRVRHEAFGPRTRPRRPTTPIMSGSRRQRRSRTSSHPGSSQPALQRQRNQRRLPRRPWPAFCGEHEDARTLAGAVRQHDSAADLLVGLTRIDAQRTADFHGLVELGLRGLAKTSFTASSGSYQLAAFDELRALEILLDHASCLCSSLWLQTANKSSPVSRPQCFN